MFRKPAAGLKRTLFLLLVPAVILLVRYLMQDLESVRDRTTWLSKPAELQHDAADNTGPYKVTLAALNGGNAAGDSSPDQPKGQLSKTSQSDQTTTDSTQRYFIPHENAEDVSIVAARSGPESTDWIEEFCED